MFFMFFVTSVLSSEYMVNLLMRAGLMMFLGPENVEMNFNTQINNDTQDLSGLEDPLYNGTYYYVSSDNFENYLTELGVGYFLRKLALLAFPIITVTRKCPETEDCSWSIKTDAGLRSHVIDFQTGEWVEDVTMDGREIKTTFSSPSPNTLVEFQMSDTVNTTLVRHFFHDRMEVIMNVNDVNATSLFKRNSS